MKRYVIIGGAPINDYEKIKKLISKEDFFVFCDSGLKHMNNLSVSPDLIIGDFDSHKNPCIDVETLILPCEKDDTDTFFAAKEGIKRGFEEFLLIGVIGGRLDHSLGNVSILLYLFNHNKKATLADDYSVMEIVGKEPVYLNDEFFYFSLLNIDGNASGVNIENAKYPLKDANVNCDYSYSISNEPVKNKTTKIYINDAKMLLIKIDKPNV